MTDAIDLLGLLERPEDETLDFKAKSYDLKDMEQKRSFAKDLASLTNTPRDRTAYLVLGVKKHLDGSYGLRGIDNPMDDGDLQGVAASLLEPTPRFSYQSIRHRDVLLGLVVIPADQRLPAMPKKTLGPGFVEGRIYFRRGSQNALASTQEQERIWDWFLRRTPSATSPRMYLDAEALLLGPVEALNLTSRVGEAQRLKAVHRTMPRSSTVN